jgi:3'(2'), 5'-bisphosphate nucleotidase
MRPDRDLLPDLLRLAKRAGRVVLEHYEGHTEVRAKADESPVTAADEAAEAVILEGLATLSPDIPVVAEERVAAGKVPDLAGGRFWLVDPLDGTKEFLSRNGEFTVNIALIEDRSPVLGVVLAPARGLMWWGVVGESAWIRGNGDARPIAVRPRPKSGIVAVASRSHRDAETDAFLAEEGATDLISAGSSLKFCLVAEGKADVYPRFGPTMEWDTAAGHAVLLAAGGHMTTRDGKPFLYQKPGFKNPGFIATGARGA